MRNILELKEVLKMYGDYCALNRVSMRVPEGSVFGLLGPNGAGKTSLLRIINRITAPDAGQVLFKNEPLQAAHSAQIGYLPEERGLYKKMEVGEQALYLAQLKGLSRQEAGRRLKEWFERFELQGWWGKRIEELSKGMQQKVQFIITVLHEPELLVLDEPFTGFDPINAELIRNELQRLRSKGTTILLSTHRMESVETMCSHIALIDRAQKVIEGSVREIRAQNRQHVYSVEYSGTDVFQGFNLPENGRLVSDELTENHRTAQLYLPTENALRSAVQHLVAERTLISFKEELPGMEEIFIQYVSNKGNDA